MQQPSISLVLIDRARQMLAEAKTIPEVKDIRDKAQAIKDYAKQQGYSQEIQNSACELKLRAERKLGELTREMEKNHGGRPTQETETPLIVRAVPRPPTLAELGIDHNDSHRWQRIAKLPEEKFEQHIAETKEHRGELTTTSVLRLAKEHEREVKRQDDAQRVAEVAVPTGKFATIVIDPPWDFGDEGDVDQFGRGRPVYQTMTLDEIKALPVSDLAEVNSHLYLWITNRSLPKGFGLLEAWGFRYITCLTWCKPSIGMGNYFRGSTEQVLFGVKGSLPLREHNIGTWFQAPRGKEHSDKPDEFYQLVERASPPGYLEMFARRERPNWKVWGNTNG